MLFLAILTVIVLDLMCSVLWLIYLYVNVKRIVGERIEVKEGTRLRIDALHVLLLLNRCEFLCVARRDTGWIEVICSPSLSLFLSLSPPWLPSPSVSPIWLDHSQSPCNPAGPLVMSQKNKIEERRKTFLKRSAWAVFIICTIVVCKTCSILCCRKGCWIILFTSSSLSD